MPKGFGGVRQKSKESKERREAAGNFLNVLWFTLEDGQEAVVRFLEQGDDIHWAECHEVPVEGRAWGDDVVCLDQERDGTPCPGCEKNLPRRFRGWISLIWEDAPVYERYTEGENKGRLVKENGKKKVIGHKPQVAVWKSGIRLFEELDEIDANYGGLMSRRFKVKRKGVKTDTKYSIVPAVIDGGKQPMSSDEEKLAGDKPDLNSFTAPGNYDTWGTRPGQTAQSTTSGSSNGGGSSESSPAKSGNPFMRGR
jgi:hypothetical protein